MLNDTDTVRHTFKRAFYRVDGVTMYACWAIWVGILIWTLFGPEGAGLNALVILLAGLMNPFVYLLLGLMRAPGLITALVIAGLNVRFLLFG
jgi:hypothetical protein